MVDRSVDSNGKYNDRFPFRHQQEDRKYYDGHRPGGRGRTFYNRRAQHLPSETLGFNTRGQQTHPEGFLNRNGDTNYDGSWQERPMKGRDRAWSERSNKSVSFEHKWQEQNGYSSNSVTRGSKYNSSKQLAKSASPDHSDYESDPWNSTSTESTFFSPSVCSNSSVASSTVVPSSPNAHEDAGEERSSGRNIWKERLEFYHSAQPKSEEEENIMIKRAIEESQKLEEERQRQILDETTNRVRSLSVNEVEHEEIPVEEVIEEPELATSASSPASVDDVSLGTSCDAVKVQTASDRTSTSSDGDTIPSTVPETCTLQDCERPCVSSEEMHAAKSLPVLAGSEDIHSPSGLVAFCQSDSSAFTSFITAKHASSPVVVQGCDRRLRNASTANRGSSRCQTGNSTPDYDDPAPGDSDSPQLHNEVDSDRPYCGSDEASQTSAESDEASSYEQNSVSPCAVYENISEGQSAVYDNSVYVPDGCNEGVMAPYPPGIPVPMPALPPRPPCCYPPVPGMTYAYQPAGPAYMNPETPCYSSGVSIIQHCQYPMYPMMSPSGMMPPAVGMMPMAYPHPPLPPAGPYCPSCPRPPGPCYSPFPAPAPCCQPYPVRAACCPPYPAPAPYWIPPSFMYRPMRPELPW